jgi:hypothetical protein
MESEKVNDAYITQGGKGTRRLIQTIVSFLRLKFSVIRVCNYTMCCMNYEKIVIFFTFTGLLGANCLMHIKLMVGWLTI